MFVISSFQGMGGTSAVVPPFFGVSDVFKILVVLAGVGKTMLTVRRFLLMDWLMNWP